MKIKELTAGKQYAIKRGNYPYKAVLLSTTERYVSLSRHGGGYYRPANINLGERGGLPFAVQDFKGNWVPLVVQPGNVFAQADDFEKAKAEMHAKEEAAWEARKEELRVQAEEKRKAAAAIETQFAQLNVRLQAAGLPKFYRITCTSDLIMLNVAFIEQVLDKVENNN
jgi:hypothetical protein